MIQKGIKIIQDSDLIVVYHSILQQPSCNKEKDLLLFKFWFMIKINDGLCQKAFWWFVYIWLSKFYGIFFTNLNQFLLDWSRILLHEGNDLKTSELIVIFFFFIRCHIFFMFFLTLFCCRSSFSCYVNICLFLYHLHKFTYTFHRCLLFSFFWVFSENIRWGFSSVCHLFSDMGIFVAMETCISLINIICCDKKQIPQCWKRKIIETVPKHTYTWTLIFLALYRYFNKMWNTCIIF
jgi:hypothetical protein